MINYYRIFPLSNDALTIEFGNEISETFNNYALKLSRDIDENKFEGFIETVPAYASATIFFDFYKVKQTYSQFPTAFEAVKTFVVNALKNLEIPVEIKRKIIKIPIRFDKTFALDLDFVAETNNLLPAEIIKIFTSQIYRVYMLGFLPGFAYMGEVDKKIAAPRKNSPRVKVPKGSIGIAGRQTGIYPLESPGGWQIIGRTETEIFDIKKKNPFLLQTGDLVKFYEHSL